MQKLITKYWQNNFDHGSKYIVYIMISSENVLYQLYFTWLNQNNLL